MHWSYSVQRQCFLRHGVVFTLQCWTIWRLDYLDFRFRNCQLNFHYVNLTSLLRPTVWTDSDWLEPLTKYFILFSPLGKLAGRAIYFACVNFFFFTMNKAISVSTGPIFTIFSPNGRYLREFSWSGAVFPIPQGTLPWQPILWQSCGKITYPLHLSLCHSETDEIS